MNCFNKLHPSTKNVNYKLYKISFIIYEKLHTVLIPFVVTYNVAKSKKKSIYEQQTATFLLVDFGPPTANTTFVKSDIASVFFSCKTIFNRRDNEFF